MKINKLTLTNFRTHEHHVVECSPAMLICGSNGAGKTTIAQALEFWASGKNPIAEGDSRDIGSLLKHGEQFGGVAIDVVGFEGEISRDIKPHRIALTGASKLSLADGQAKLEEWAGCTGDHARLCLRAGRFFGQLDEKGQKALLFDLLGVRLTTQYVLDQLEEQNGANFPLVATARKYWKAISNNVAQGEHRYREARKHIKRDIKQAKTILDDLEERKVEMVFATPPAAEELEANEKAIQALSQEWGAIKAKQDERKRVAADVAAAEARVAHLEEMLSEHDHEQLSANFSKYERLLEQLEKKRDSMSGNMLRRQEVSGLRERATELRGKNGNCPTCGAPVPEEQVAEWSGQAEQLEQQAATLEKAITGTPEELRSVEQRIVKGRRYLKEARETLKALGQLEQAKQNREERKARLAELPEVEIPEGYKERVEAARAVKKQLSNQAENAREWRAYLDRKKELAEEIEAKSLERECIERLCELFGPGPNGLQTQLLAKTIRPLTEQLNKILSRWGLEARFELPSADLKIRKTGGDWSRFWQLSDSERIIVALAHQVWFAQVTGFRIVILDAIEAIDADGHERLFKAVLDLVEEKELVDEVGAELVDQNGEVVTESMVDHVFLIGVAPRVATPSNIKQHVISPPATPRASKTRKTKKGLVKA